MFEVEKKISPTDCLRTRLSLNTKYYWIEIAQRYWINLFITTPSPNFRLADPQDTSRRRNRKYVLDPQQTHQKQPERTQSSASSVNIEY